MRYKTVQIGGRSAPTKYYHRLVWEAAHGPIPKGFYIDHINGNRLDNRLENLRICTNAENMCNRPKPVTNKTGYKNISMSRGYFRVQVKHKGTVIEKFFKELEPAVAFAKEARDALHGRFAYHD